MVSPTSKSISAGSTRVADLPFAVEPLALGASTTCTRLFSMLNASSKRSGTGLCELPTKPVTPGVCRTTDHESSLRSIRTST